MHQETHNEDHRTSNQDCHGWFQERRRRYVLPFMVAQLLKLSVTASLPRAASWGQKSIASVPSSTISGGLPAGVTSAMSRGSRRAASSRQPRNSSTASQASASRVVIEKKPTPTVATAPASRPSTPSIPVPLPEPPVLPEAKPPRMKKDATSTVRETASPAPSITTESDVGSAPPEPSTALPSRPSSAADSVLSSVPDVVPIPSVPPGLFAPPGLPSPSRPPRLATDLPPTPLLATQSAYFDKMNPSVRDMIEEVKDRRGSSSIISPFPDFDKTLQTLSENDGGFSFNLDPKLAEGVESGETMVEFEAEASTPFHGTYIQAFPALQTGSNIPAPPGLSYPSPISRSIYNPLPPRPIRNSPLSSTTNYMGSFDPFAEGAEDGGSPSTSLNSQLDDDRKVSRFGFARGRHAVSSAASSPRLTHATQMQPLGIEEPAYPPRWTPPTHGYGLHPTPPPLVATSSQGPSPSVGSRFQPFDGELGEAQLREFIQASRLQATRDKELEKESFGKRTPLSLSACNNG
jgi:CCR4-NOT transcription complex subunit 4